MHPRVWATSSDGLFQYVSLTKNKLEEALDVIRNGFFKDESVSVAVGLREEPAAIRELDGLVLDAAMDGVSIFSEEKRTGKIVGCMISKICVKENEPEGLFKKFDCKHPAARAFLEVNAEIDKIVNAFDLLQTDCYLESMFTGILPKFRRKGIARKLQELTDEITQRLLNGENVKVSLTDQHLPLHPIPTATIGFPTSIAMKKACDNLGYVEAMKIDFQEYGMKSKLVTPSVISKIPPVVVMYKHFRICKL